MNGDEIDAHLSLMRLSRWCAAAPPLLPVLIVVPPLGADSTSGRGGGEELRGLQMFRALILQAPYDHPIAPDDVQLDVPQKPLKLMNYH